MQHMERATKNGESRPAKTRELAKKRSKRHDRIKKQTERQRPV